MSSQLSVNRTDEVIWHVRYKMSSLLFGNGTDEVSWHANPTRRGTSDLVSTCVITMLLCVWTAVHLNVPEPGSFWGLRPKARKIGWLVLALLAPELVAYTAWYVLPRDTSQHFSPSPSPNSLQIETRELILEQVPEATGAKDHARS